MKSSPNTLEKLIKYYEQSTIKTKNINPIITGINNFNNVETADRKLIINNKLEFWVHDKILNENCDYFKDKKDIIKDKGFILLNNQSNIEKTIKNIEINYPKKKEKNKNYKIEIQIPNSKTNNFTKQNSKDLTTKIYKKIYNNYNTYNTINTQKNEKIINNKTLATREKIRNKITIKGIRQRRSYANNQRNNNKDILNKSCITDDLIKIQKLKEIIKKRKLALKTIDYSNIGENNNNNKAFKTIHNNSRRNKLRENITLGDNYNKNIISKKSYFNKILNNNISLKKPKLNVDNGDLNNKIIQTDENINNNINKNDSKSFIKITKININEKNEYELFFDFLLWMYSKDIRRLKKFSKNFETLLSILSLANFLKIKKNFYNSLFTQINKNIDKNFFNSINWSRSKISFYALEKIIPLLSGNYNRIYALISWLKPKKTHFGKILSNNKIIEEIKKTKDFFLVRNYIKKYKLFYSLDKKEIIELKNIFNEFSDCFDMEAIFDKYIINSNELNNKLNSIYQVLNQNEYNKEINYKSDKIDKKTHLTSKLMNGQNFHKKIKSDLNPNF